ncbi:hypothetical protein B0H11DRAFT_1359232 [Mycena galericulata]|nr:hypothetical protein B0H11DRAFT_1359232 [Mycena galericulata]
MATVLIKALEFVCTLDFSMTRGECPNGYLFLYPATETRIGTSMDFCLPQSPAFWSLDPSGNQRLTTEDAKRLGFPSISFKMVCSGSSWDAKVYMACRQFALAKGFDPDSEEIARHLGYPLFQSSDAHKCLFAHIHNDSSNVADSEDVLAPNKHGFGFQPSSAEARKETIDRCDVEMIPVSDACTFFLLVKLVLIISLAFHGILLAKN